MIDFDCIEYKVKSAAASRLNFTSHAQHSDYGGLSVDVLQVRREQTYG